MCQQDFLFYWHFGPKESSGANTPVIFWTNGGPGCSAMEGAINELGPLSLFKAKDGSDLYTGALSDNPYSWNAYAHLVTVDQPRYTPIALPPHQ
jgi:carboxypeptidase C (cathepsin A)